MRDLLLRFGIAGVVGTAIIVLAGGAAIVLDIVQQLRKKPVRQGP